MREWRRCRRVVVVGSLAVVIVGASVTGVRAGAASGGTWQGTMVLNIFPCPGGGTCPGSFSGSLSGSVAGLDSAGHPFAVIWPDPTTLAPLVNLSASFTYSELCPLGALGSAGGSFTLSGGYVDDNGTISHNGAMTGNFGWTRAGLALVVQTYGGVLTGGGSTLATQQTLGYGAGGFVPETVPSTCFNVQPVTAQIAGSFGNPQ